MQIKFVDIGFRQWIWKRYRLVLLLSPGVLMLVIFSLHGEYYGIIADLIFSGVTAIYSLIFASYFSKEPFYKDQADEYMVMLSSIKDKIFEPHNVIAESHNELKDHFNFFSHKLKIFIRSLNHFWKYIFGLYLVMLFSNIILLLLKRFVRLNYQYGVATDSLFSFLQVSFNTLSVLALLNSFLMLYAFREYDSSGLARRKVLSRISFIRRLGVFILIFMIAAYGLMVCSGIFYVKNHEVVENIHIAFYCISGLVNGIVLAMLIGRLDSKFINLPTTFIMVLFLYPALQPLFVVFGEHPVLTRILVGLSLVCKIYFFLLMYYIITTGRVMFYFYGFTELGNRINAIYENQFEVIILKESNHKQGIEIRNKNKIVFHSEDHSPDRNTSLKYIKHLKENIARFRRDANYKEDFGLHWVEIAINESFKFQSIIYKTKDDLEDMLREIERQLPYCKVSIL